MSAERATYVDSSAILKLVVREPGSVLTAAGSMLPANIRSLEAIHLATAQQLGADLARIVTYDDRMSEAARTLGFAVAAPS